MSQRRDYLYMGTLFVTALLVRFWLAAQIVFPPPDDPAFYIQTARHLAEGRGFVTDVIWNYFVPFNSVTHPSHEFWMPLTSIVMALPLRLLGDTLAVAQLPGIISGALLVPVTYWMGRRLWPQRRWRILAAGLLIPGAVLVYQSVNADSASLFTLLATLTLWTAAEAYTRHSAKWAAVCGVLGGLSYLTRSHGSVLIGAVGFVWFIGWWRTPREGLKLVGIMIGAALIVIVPWWLRNLNAFGSIQPVSLITSAAARDYGEWFNYTDLPSWSKTLSAGWGAVLSLRWYSLTYGLGVILLITFPYGVIGLLAAVWQREPLFRLFAVSGVLLWLVATLLFTVPSLTGSFYHSAGIYAPWAALGFASVLKGMSERVRWRRWVVVLGAVVGGLVIGQSWLAWPATIAQSRADAEQMQAITTWLHANVPPDQPILTTGAHTLNYASGYPALSIPVAQTVNVLHQVADRYGVRYVVVTEQVSAYPQALDQPQARARLLANFAGIWIYELEH